MNNRTCSIYMNSSISARKAFFLPLILCTLLFSVAACQSVSPRTNTSATQQATSPLQPVPENTVPEVQNLMYENEGFVSKDTYVVIIVQPFSNAQAGTEIENQAKKRAFTSLLKYKHAQGKILSQNGTTQIVNVINECGTLTKIDDAEQKRSVYQFVVKKDNLKQFVDGL